MSSAEVNANHVGRAPGKLILCGEHAVVHGYPAIALAVGLCTEVLLRPCHGPTHAVGQHDPRLDQALQAVLGAGWSVWIDSELPIGRGMGSSASLAVACCRAHADHDLDPDALFEAALPAERVFHGNPSGLDVAVIAHGGALWFERGPPIVLRPLPAPAWDMVVLDSGTPGDTATMVAGVAARRPGIDPELDAIGALTHRMASVLDDAQAVGPLLTQAHHQLQRIGVSTPALDKLVQLALDHGALGAKLSGAGGGGVVLALVDDPSPLLQAAASAGISAWCCETSP